MNFSFLQRHSHAFIPFLVILLGCCLWPELELLVPSFPEMKQVFNVSDGQIQNLISANFLGFLIGILFAGPFCDSVGRRTVLICSGVLYLFMAFACAMTTEFHLLMLFRFLQGFFMTGPAIAETAILVDITKGPRQVFWLSLSGSSVTFCMAMAPIVGAWVNEAFGLRGNLWFIFLIGAIGLIPLSVIVPETLPIQDRKKVVIRELMSNYFVLLKDQRFMQLSFPVCALAASYWIYVGVCSLYMVDYKAIPLKQFGYYQGPIIGCYSILAIFASALLKKIGLRKCIVLGISVMFVGIGSLLAMNLSSYDSAELTTLFMVIFVGGMAPVTTALFSHCLTHLPPNLQASAQALLQGQKLLYAFIGTTILAICYSGPLLPVAIMLFTILLVTTFVLWRAQKYF